MPVDSSGPMTGLTTATTDWSKPLGRRTPDRRWYGGKDKRLDRYKEEHLLHAARVFEQEGLSVGIGCGDIGGFRNVAAYFDIRRGGIRVPPQVRALPDEALLAQAAMQWEIIGDGYRALRMDVIRERRWSGTKGVIRETGVDIAVQGPAIRVDIYWLYGWEEGT